MSIVDEENFNFIYGENSDLRKFMQLKPELFLKNLSFEDIELLNYYLKHPKATVYDYCMYTKKKSNDEMRKMYRHTKKIIKEGFLEVVVIGNNKSEKKKDEKKPCILSLTGIFYHILNTTEGRSCIDLIKHVQKYYKENPLFSLFLYPFIEEKTIDNIDYDISFFSIVIKYLKVICKDIVDAIKWLKNTDEIVSSNNYKKRIFVWYDDSRNNNVNIDLADEIRFFLKTTLKWENVDSLKIETRIDNNTIEIIDANNSTRNSTITILKSENKAVLRQNGRLIHEFFVIPNDGYSSMETKSNINPIDDIKTPFLERWINHLIDFLTDLRTQILHSNLLFTNPTFDTLSKDERYNKALKYLKRELD
jgi:hypothetical protein